ncbi:hypothetical protein BPT24_096 [Tenacibaculum phage pT24]|uniref:Uncharacterized protein n=1 Tax=Tenacibaculum phage pT24 TaxID=1880590 RepID=A0A1B4XWM3_9CAUD|nr:hypothetical protein HYP10_gp096 [Tenacibaculum phage pT24]BAV39221.1 hypothetical protein BPT24_096 [Tenacibaculum phage pT24]
MDAKIIREVLVENDIVLKEIAEKLEISQQHLNNIWNSKDVKTGTLFRIVEVSGLPLVLFLVRCEEVLKCDPKFEHFAQMYMNLAIE